ncbi:hypothetical protein BCV70DRAFT_218023 [Testicularia cyperi]|uniref:methylated diphthine methylhydrolase n=1 Tax=Testicularia cyperi TaxID=1882483 RepID=A0A317XL69_9BASI|nr:hypothetical protein BCV70DRAFT_218023 [Testicularia cyperi]
MLAQPYFPMSDVWDDQVRSNITAMKAKSLYTASTGLCADSVESVPGAAGLFALATYQVDKEEIENALNVDEDGGYAAGGGTSSSSSTSPAYTRRGTCTLYSVTNPGSDSTSQGVDVETLQKIDTPAILDMKWSSTSTRGKLLGIADAKSNVSIHRLIESRRLEPVRSLLFNNRQALCLSLDWSDRTASRKGRERKLPDDTSLVVSQSDGSIAYLPSLERALSSTTSSELEALQTSISDVKLDESRRSGDESGPEEKEDWEQTSEDGRIADLEAQQARLNAAYDAKPAGLETWGAHDYEAWIVGFDCWSPCSSIWTGGDDLCLKGWDLRTPVSRCGRSPTFTTTKPFDGGVTTLQSHHLRQHLWAVGSYDSKLRLFDARAPARPLSETDTGGGIWRVKWHPTDPATLLVGCMHDGFKILRLPALTALQPEDGGTKELRGQEMDLVTRFDQHHSLAYGCDWDRGTYDTVDQDNARLVYSCSFYDASMHVWRSQ